MELLVPQARAILAGESSFVMSSRLDSEALLQFLADPSDEETRLKWEAWVADVHRQFNDAFSKTQDALKQVPDEDPEAVRFLTPAVIARDEMHQALLGFGPILKAGLDLADVRRIAGSPFDSIYSTLVLVFAYVFDCARTDAGRKKRGAMDLWQALYLGIPIQAFVTDDVRLLETARAISRLQKAPREILTSDEFFARL